MRLLNIVKVCLYYFLLLTQVRTFFDTDCIEIICYSIYKGCYCSFSVKVNGWITTVLFFNMLKIALNIIWYAVLFHLSHPVAHKSLTPTTLDHIQLLTDKLFHWYVPLDSSKLCLAMMDRQIALWCGGFWWWVTLGDSRPARHAGLSHSFHYILTVKRHHTVLISNRLDNLTCGVLFRIKWNQSVGFQGLYSLWHQIYVKIITVEFTCSAGVFAGFGNLVGGFESWPGDVSPTQSVHGSHHMFLSLPEPRTRPIRATLELR